MRGDKLIIYGKTMTRKKPRLIKWDSAKYLKTEIAKVHRTITRARDLWSISVS